jgi:putative PIN family toxin of toxin-antitoxin system
MRVVFDTSVVVAASRSRAGASFLLVSSIPSESFRPCLSVALYAEWQQALSRQENRPVGASAELAAGFLRFIASQCHLQEIYFLWRPFLKDADDDMVLELAVAARCGIIVTHNVRDFAGADRFGIEPMVPGDFLRMIRGTR